VSLSLVLVVQLHQGVGVEDEGSSLEGPQGADPVRSFLTCPDFLRDEDGVGAWHWLRLHWDWL
jgi:hypothetical protein